MGAFHSSENTSSSFQYCHLPNGIGCIFLSPSQVNRIDRMPLVIGILARLRAWNKRYFKLNTILSNLLFPLKGCPKFLEIFRGN